jgi:hypothetical protein
MTDISVTRGHHGSFRVRVHDGPQDWHDDERQAFAAVTARTREQDLPHPPNSVPFNQPAGRRTTSTGRPSPRSASQTATLSPRQMHAMQSAGRVRAAGR